jgi:hypothetical protein
MTATLRPMNLGEILDRTFQIYRSRFLVFAGIAALPALTMMLAASINQFWLQSHRPHGHILIFYMSFGELVAAAVLYHLSGFVHLFIRPAFISSTARTIEGENPSIRAAIAAVRANWKGYLALDLLLMAAILPLPAVLFIVSAVELGAMVARSGPGTPGTALAGLLVLSLIGILGGYLLWIGSCLALAFPASVMEGVPSKEAFRRSWQLSKATRGRLIFTWLLVNVLGWVLGSMFSWSGYFVLRALPHEWGNGHNYLLYGLLYSLSTTIASILLGPIYPIALTLFYYDQRMRREGYDIERLMDAAGLNAPQTPSAEAVQAATQEALP